METIKIDSSKITNAKFVEVDMMVKSIDLLFLNGIQMRDKKSSKLFIDIIHGFSSTPLANYMKEHIEKLNSGKFSPENMTALCIGRAYLLSGMYDFIFELLDLPINIIENTSEMQFKSYTSDNLASSIQKWLADLAMNGFKRLEISTVENFYQNFEKIEEDNEFIRMYSILLGFYHELLESLRNKIIPHNRWTDILMRTYLLTLANPITEKSEKIDGALKLVSADIYHHENIVSYILHGFLGTRYVTLQFSEYVIDEMTIGDLWNSFPNNEYLLALEENKILKIEGTINGNQLIIEKYDNTNDLCDFSELFDELSNKNIDLTKISDFDKHPTMFSIPLFVEAIEGKIILGDIEIPVINKVSGKIFGILKYQNGLVMKPLIVDNKHQIYQPRSIRQGSRLKQVLITKSQNLMRKKTELRKFD